MLDNLLDKEKSEVAEVVRNLFFCYRVTNNLRKQNKLKQQLLNYDLNIYEYFFVKDTDQLFKDFKQEIKLKRDVGHSIIELHETKCKDLIDDLNNFYIEYLGYQTIKWQVVNQIFAELILEYVLSHDLAYNGKIMKKEEAKKFVESFFSFFEGNIQCYTNGDYITDRSSKISLSSWNPITEATFDSGIIVTDKKKIGIIWFMDED